MVIITQGWDHPDNPLRHEPSLDRCPLVVSGRHALFGPPAGDSVIEGPHYAVVLQSDALNRIEGYNVVVIVPFTSKPKVIASRYAVQPSEGNGFEVVSHAMCEQVITVSREFLGTDLAGRLTEYDSGQIAARAAVFALGLPVPSLLAAGLLQP